MTKFARVVNDEAVDVFDTDPAGLFTPDITFEAVPDEVVRGSRRHLDEFEQVVWEAPNVAISDSRPSQYGRIITRLAFLSRFTDAEAVAIDLASIGATVQAAALRRANAKISAAEEIQLDNSETRAGVQALETAGLIASGRAAEILDSPVLPSEVPARYRATYGLPEVPAV